MQLQQQRGRKKQFALSLAILSRRVQFNVAISVDLFARQHTSIKCIGKRAPETKQKNFQVRDKEKKSYWMKNDKGISRRNLIRAVSVCLFEPRASYDYFETRGTFHWTAIFLLSFKLGFVN